MSSLVDLSLQMIETGLGLVRSSLQPLESSLLAPAGDGLLLKPVRLLETGLLRMNTAFEAIQSSLKSISGEKQTQAAQPAPVEGPYDLDAAVSDFANRLAGIARFTHWEMSENLPVQEVLTAAQRSFGGVKLQGPAIFVLPLRLTLSFGTLGIQQALRGVVTFEVIGARNYSQFITDFFESFTDTPIFAGLEYQDLLSRYEARLLRAPDDDATRIEIGRLQIKCGLHEQAASNLLQAARNPSMRASALHDAAVALHRSGRLEESARASSDAL